MRLSIMLLFDAGALAIVCYNINWVINYINGASSNCIYTYYTYPCLVSCDTACSILYRSISITSVLPSLLLILGGPIIPRFNLTLSFEVPAAGPDPRHGLHRRNADVLSEGPQLHARLRHPLVQHRVGGVPARPAPGIAPRGGGFGCRRPDAYRTALLEAKLSDRGREGLLEVVVQQANALMHALRYAHGAACAACAPRERGSMTRRTLRLRECGHCRRP